MTKEKTDSQKKQLETFKNYIKDRTKTKVNYPWKEINEHVTNLIEYYSFIAEKTGEESIKQRVIKLILSKNKLEEDEQGKKEGIIALTDLDLIFLEYYAKDELIEQLKDKSKIDLSSVTVPGINIKNEVTNDL